MGVELIVYTIITVALAAYSYVQAKKNANSGTIAQKANPSTIAQRGAYVHRLIGRHRVPPIVLWAGNRRIVQESRGSGDSKVKVNVYFEGGIHAVGVGLGYKLHRIRRDGKTVWKGPITRDSHPSGTDVQTDDHGGFVIYWGEEDQPENTHAGDSSRLGLSSRWPSTMYIYWKNYYCGESAIWGDVDYEIEYRPEKSTLSSTDSWIEGSLTASSNVHNVVSVDDAVSWPTTRAEIQINGRRLNRFAPGRKFALSGNTADDDYTVFSSSYSAASGRTTIVVEEDLTGSDNNGTVTPYQKIVDDGPNGAHVIHELLFARWPYGLALPTDDFDIDSLEDVGTTLAAEGLRTHVWIDSGNEAESILGELMQDLGMMIPFNPATGKYEFRLIRETAVVSTIPAGMVMDPKPEPTTSHQIRRTDQLDFTFNDVNRKFRENVYPVDDDSQFDALAVKRSRPIAMPTVNNWPDAILVGERRALEELSDQSKLRVFLNRASRTLMPGDRLLISSVSPRQLMVAEIMYQQLSSKTEFGCLLDFYGLVFADYEPAETGEVEDQDEESVQPFSAFTWVEVPAYISGRVMQIALLAIRESELITHAVIRLSRAGSSYEVAGSIIGFAAGGTLQTELNASAGSYISQGPQIDVIGPDIGNVADYSSDVESWRSGRQIMVIGNEWFYLQNVTMIGAAVYRLDGILRARFGTSKATHASGTPVFIFAIEDLETLEDALLIPGKTLYVTAQPYEEAEFVPEDELAEVDATLVGIGVKPLDPINLRVRGGNNFYTTGQDIDFDWAYRSLALPNTGAGFQPAGDPTGSSPPEGEFVIEILTTGDSLVATYDDIVLNTWQYLNSQLQADLGSETSFKVKLTNVNGGYSSLTLEITVEFIP